MVEYHRAKLVKSCLDPAVTAKQHDDDDDFSSS
jgi:hypothetical protein